MRNLVIVPRNHGMPQEKAQELLQNNWSVFSNVAIRAGGNIVTLDNQAVGHVEMFDVWCSPSQPMIPELGVAYLLLDLAEQGGDPATIDTIVKTIFGSDMTIDVLAKRVPPRTPPPQEPEP